MEYVFAVKREAGKPVRDVLPEIAVTLITSLHFPKPMRWGSLEVRFARPIRWLVSLLGSEVVEFQFAGLKAGRTTWGHRFLSKEPIVLSTAREYFEQMRSNYVMVHLCGAKGDYLAPGAGGCRLGGAPLKKTKTCLTKSTTWWSIPRLWWENSAGTT